ncbi:MAG: hypothetical protein WA277_09200 [Nitrospirota bacterium]
MQAKREDRLFFIMQLASFLSLYNASFFWRRDIPHGFFQRVGKATAKRNNIKEKYYAVDSISDCFGCRWGDPMGD